MIPDLSLSHTNGIWSLFYLVFSTSVTKIPLINLWMTSKSYMGNFGNPIKVICITSPSLTSGHFLFFITSLISQSLSSLQFSSSFLLLLFLSDFYRTEFEWTKGSRGLSRGETGRSQQGQNCDLIENWFRGLINFFLLFLNFIFYLSFYSLYSEKCFILSWRRRDHGRIVVLTLWDWGKGKKIIFGFKYEYLKILLVLDVVSWV